MATTTSGTFVVNGSTVGWTILHPKDCSVKSNGAVGRRPILVGHGHGQNSKFISQGGIMGDHPRNLADAGYIVGCVDNTTEFFDNDAMDRNLALRDLMVTTMGCKPKVGWSGMSMGGGTGLAFLLLHPTLVSCIFAFAPGWDLQWIGSKPGYVAPYSTDALTADPTWATELATDYPTGFTSHDPAENLAAFRNTVPIRVTHASDDTLLPYHGSRYFVDTVNDPKVTFRTPDVTGGHSSTFMKNIPTAETLHFFEENWVD